MAHILNARIGEKTTTTGLGAYTVTGSLGFGHRTFSSVMLANDYFYGFVEGVDENGKPTAEWEEGLYTYTGANTLARTEVHASSNNNAPVNWGAGTKHIRIAMTARLARSLVTGSVAANATPAPGPSPTPTPAPSNSGVRPGVNPSLYGPVAFAEEFNGSDINRSVWNTTIWYEAEPAVKNWDVNANGNSLLRIWPALGPNGRYFNRTIDTDGKYYATYGYFECRAKLCKGYGAWPAIWVFNHIGADRPELDVMEAYCGGERAGNGGWSNLNDEPLSYTGTIWKTEGEFMYSINSAGQFGEMRLDQAFHKYGMHWDATGVQFYFDDQPLGARFESPHFTRPMYLMLDLWYGSASGDPNSPPGGSGFAPTGPGNSYEIDYFRHWPLANGSGGSSGNTPSPSPSPTPTPTPTPAPTATNVQFWGEDSTYGYKSGVGGQVATTVPEQFASAFPTLFVENKGVNLVSSKEMLEGSGDMDPFGGWQDNMQESNATHVIINVGINDAAENRPKADYQYYLRNMAQQAVTLGKRVIFVSANPCTSLNLGPYRDWMQQVAQEENCGFIDGYQYFVNYGQVNGVSMATMVPDGTHPSDSMYINLGNYIAQQFPNVD